MEIQKYSPEEENKLSVVKNEIAVALQSRMCRDISPGDLFDILKRVITKTYMSARYPLPTAVELGYIIEDTRKYIHQRFAYLRENEIEICFTYGASGDYGEFHGLSFPSFSKFIKAYSVDKNRVELTSKPAEEVKVPSLEERFDLAASNAIKSFEDYKNKRDISIIAPTVYKFLFKLNLIKYDQDEVDDFMKDAAINVKQDLLLQKAATMDKWKHNELKNMIDNKPLLQQKIVFEARRLGLYQYFQELIMDDGNLEGFLRFKKQEALK